MFIAYDHKLKDTIQFRILWPGLAFYGFSVTTGPCNLRGYGGNRPKSLFVSKLIDLMRQVLPWSDHSNIYNCFFLLHLMLFRELITVCSKDYIQHINALYGQNTEFVNVNTGGSSCNHCVLKVKEPVSSNIACGIKHCNRRITYFIGAYLHMCDPVLFFITAVTECKYNCLHFRTYFYIFTLQTWLSEEGPSGESRFWRISSRRHCCRF
jgi:hypothetical protein